MAILPGNLARVSTQMQTAFANRSIVGTQNDILRAQQELTTGRRINNLSDDPGAAALSQQLRKQLEQRTSYENNLNLANRHLNEVDTVLADVTDLLRQANTVASGSIGATVTNEERKGSAEIVDSIYRQMLQLANKNWNGMYLFAGDRLTTDPYAEEASGVKFVGSERLLKNATDESTELAFQANPAEIFGTSTRQAGTADLTPALSADTRLADLGGANGNGVRPGIIELSDGTTTVEVDLSTADTVGDVIDRINAAGVGGITAGLTAGPFGLGLTGGAGDEITVREVGGGSVASDLGILQTTSAGAGVPLAGGNVNPRLNGLTLLSDLNGGTGFDQAGGLTITNGLASATLDFSTDTNLRDALNRINTAGLGVQAAVAADGKRLEISNLNQGTELRITQASGTTADDLGLRTFSPTTALSDLNDGKGVSSQPGADFTITDSLGVAFDVDVSGLGTTQDVINAINAAAAGAGAGVTASFAASGNGLQLTDTAGGGGTIAVAAVTGGRAAADLGLTTPAAGNVITGSDVRPVTNDGIFRRLLDLKSALLSNDAGRITGAAEGLDKWEGNVIAARGTAGARVQEFESRLNRLGEQNIATRTALSELEDTDYAASILRFESLQTTLQATMSVFGRISQNTLMDFLR